MNTFSAIENIIIVLNNTALILFASLATAIPLQAGLFNLGVGAQLVVGGVVASLIVSLQGMPWPLTLFFALSGGVVTAASLGLIPALLKARHGTHEAVSSLILNCAVFCLVQLPVKEMPKATLTALLPGIAIKDGCVLSPAIFFALALCAFYGWWMKNTIAGYEIRVLSKNHNAARYGGIDPQRYWILLMLVAGMVAGLGGALDITGSGMAATFDLYSGYGYDGFTAAIISQGCPISLAVSSLFLGILRSALQFLSIDPDYSSSMILIIEAMLVFFILSGKQFVRAWFDKKSVKE
ncbi:MAG: hypothetical protein V1753_07200 [Pseudomonadota bacterium]